MQIAPDGVKIKITPMHGGEPYVTPIDSIEYQAAEKAIQKVFNKKPFPTRGGGSIPIVAQFEKHLNLKTILLGFGLNDDNLHAPNEKYNIENFFIGIKTLSYYYQYYSQLK